MNMESSYRAEVSVENAVLEAKVTVDVIELLRHMAAQTTNTIDDALVEMVALARNNMDWKGYAKGQLGE